MTFIIPVRFWENVDSERILNPMSIIKKVKFGRVRDLDELITIWWGTMYVRPLFGPLEASKIDFWG